jgi:diguanylate cyclase (GGDEF)-like protein
MYLLPYTSILYGNNHLKIGLDMATHIFTEEEIEDIIVKTNHFMNEHLLNYHRAIKRIVCKGLIKKETIDDYRTLKNCSFPAYVDFLKKSDPKTDYSEIIDIHHLFHQLVSEILSKYSTNQAISEKLFNSLYFTHSNLLNLLNDIISKFDFTKNQLDNLTKTWNRGIFMKFIEKEYSKIKRGGETFSLAYFDIDNFKKINDTYSHNIGDNILRESIHIIKNYLREYDSIARWGGDEFLILFPSTKSNVAFSIIERIKNIIDNRTFYFDLVEIKISCSFGISEANLDNTIEEIIDEADTLLYKAKELGKNRIEI